MSVQEIHYSQSDISNIEPEVVFIEDSETENEEQNLALSKKHGDGCQEQAEDYNFGSCCNSQGQADSIIFIGNQQQLESNREGSEMFPFLTVDRYNELIPKGHSFGGVVYAAEMEFLANQRSVQNRDHLPTEPEPISATTADKTGEKCRKRETAQVYGKQIASSNKRARVSGVREKEPEITTPNTSGKSLATKNPAPLANFSQISRPESDDDCVIINTEPKVKTDLRRKKISMETLEKLLNSTVRPPWKVLYTDAGLQVIHMSECLIPLLSLCITTADKLEISLRDKKLPKSHVLFKLTNEVQEPGKPLRLSYIWEVLHLMFAYLPVAITLATHEGVLDMGQVSCQTVNFMSRATVLITKSRKYSQNWTTVELELKKNFDPVEKLFTLIPK